MLTNFPKFIAKTQQKSCNKCSVCCYTHCLVKYLMGNNGQWSRFLHSVAL